jgi:organic radical activating enzyme
VIIVNTIMGKNLIAIKQKNDVMQLTWVINNICTNACSYCPTNLHEGTNHHYEWKNAERFLNKLMSRHKKINLSISGGEPTLSPHLIDLVKMFHNKGHPISVTTNGARSVRYYEEISPYVNNFSFSFHPSFEDVNFKDKVMASNKYSGTNVRVMMDTRYWDRCVEVYKSFAKESDVSVEAVRLQDWDVGNMLGRDYTADQDQWILDNPYKSKNIDINTIIKFVKRKKMPILTFTQYHWDDGTETRQNPTDIINSGLNDFRGWSCNIGLESLFVHYDGKIQRGNCRQGTPVRWLGNINEPELIQWPTEPEICVQKECHCSTDIIISKKKI